MSKIFNIGEFVEVNIENNEIYCGEIISIQKKTKTHPITSEKRHFLVYGIRKKNIKGKFEIVEEVFTSDIVGKIINENKNYCGFCGNKIIKNETQN